MNQAQFTAALDFLSKQYDDFSRYSDVEMAETPRQRKERLRAERLAITPRVKGHCRKCGKHIGRGVAFHEKACKA